MKFFRQLRPLLALVCVIIITLIAVSLLDILIAVFYSRFYTNAAFIVTFGVGGVFAAAYGYTLGIQFAPVKNELARWSLIGLFFFFFLSRIEGGEYEAAFKAFGATLALGSLLFIKGTVE